MRKTVANVSRAILFTVFCAGCVTAKEPLTPPPPTIEYKVQDDPETQLTCLPRPIAPDPDTVTDKELAQFINKLWSQYGVCFRSVDDYKAFRRAIQSP